MAIKIASLDTHADGTLIVPNKLGIGTSNPIYAILDVAGNINIRGDGYLNIGSSGYGDVSIRPTGSGGGRGMSFWTYNGAAAQKVTIDLNGNVGIGTGSPSEKLHISNGNFAIEKSAYGGFLKWTQGTTSPRAGYWEWGDGTGWRMDFGPSATPRLSIYDNGNVGIGTSSPSAGLHVVSNASLDARIEGGYPQGITMQNGGFWEHKNASDTGELSFNYVGYQNGITYYRDINIYNGKYGLMARFQGSTGRLGIGTGSPAYTLDVNGSMGLANNGGLYIKNNVGTFGSAAVVDTVNQFILGSNSFTSAYIQCSQNIYFSSGSATRAVLDSSGRLGIGALNPSATLHVVGDVNIAPTTGGAYHTIRGIQAGQNAHQYFYTSNTLKWVQYVNDSNSRLYFLDADSNDGVYLAQNTTSWTANSDSRLKDVQGTLTNALDKVGQLTGVKFKWKRESDNPDAKVRVGLIAQEVRAVLPEAVDDESPDLITDEETGKVSGGLGVRYTELVPLLVNAIKELTARVVALEHA